MWTANSLEKTLMLGRLKVDGEEDNSGWDGWMVSLMQWTWTWANSGRWWGQGGLACCIPWGRKESGTIGQPNNSMIIYIQRWLQVNHASWYSHPVHSHSQLPGLIPWLFWPTECAGSGAAPVLAGRSPAAYITNYRKPGGLRQHSFIRSQFYRSRHGIDGSSAHGLTRMKSKVLAEAVTSSEGWG